MRGVHGRLRARWAHLLAEKNFSDAHVAGKMIQMIQMIRGVRAANSARLFGRGSR